MVAKAVDDYPLEVPQQEPKEGVRARMGSVQLFHERAIEINDDLLCHLTQVGAANSKDHYPCSKRPDL